MPGDKQSARQRVDYLANVEMRRLYYGESHPLAAEATPEALLSITNDDYKQFYKKYYNADNLRIVFSGKITEMRSTL